MRREVWIIERPGANALAKYTRRSTELKTLFWLLPLTGRMNGDPSERRGRASQSFVVRSPQSSNGERGGTRLLGLRKPDRIQAFVLVSVRKRRHRRLWPLAKQCWISLGEFASLA